MRKFATRLTVFALVMIAAAFAMQALLSYRIKGKTISSDDNIEITEQQNADLVFLGSSRCWVHFDPNFFKDRFHLKSVNLGVNGHSEVAASIIRLKVYLAENKAPKFAVLNLDPFMNAEIKDQHLVQKDLYARYAYFSKQSNRPIVSYFEYTFAEQYIPLYAIFKYQLLQKSLFPKNDGRDLYGFGLNDENWDTIKNPPTNLMKKYFLKSSQAQNLEIALASLQKICKDRNIKLLCIQTPVYKVLQNELVFSQTAVICENLGIPFIDANIPLIRNDIRNFYNSNHLNKNGVTKLNAFFSVNAALDAFLQ